MSYCPSWCGCSSIKSSSSSLSIYGFKCLRRHEHPLQAIPVDESQPLQLEFWDGEPCPIPIQACQSSCYSLRNASKLHGRRPGNFHHSLLFCRQQSIPRAEIRALVQAVLTSQTASHRECNIHVDAAAALKVVGDVLQGPALHKFAHRDLLHVLPKAVSPPRLRKVSAHQDLDSVPAGQMRAAMGNMRAAIAAPGGQAC